MREALLELDAPHIMARSPTHAPPRTPTGRGSGGGFFAGHSGNSIGGGGDSCPPALPFTMLGSVTALEEATGSV